MSKKTLSILMILLSLSMVGCGNTKTTQMPTETPTNTESNTDISERKENEAISTKQEDSKTNLKENTESIKKDNKTDNLKDTTKINKNTEIFYGNWVIKNVVAYGKVGTYSSEDAEKLLNKTLSFSVDKASCFGEQIEDINNIAINPVYTKTILSKSDFESGHKITLKQLGINSDPITRVHVEDSKGNGCNFYIKDDNTLILSAGGTYFELDKINDNN